MKNRRYTTCLFYELIGNFVSCFAEASSSFNNQVCRNLMQCFTRTQEMLNQIKLTCV